MKRSDILNFDLSKVNHYWDKTKLQEIKDIVASKPTIKELTEEEMTAVKEFLPLFRAYIKKSRN